MRPSGRRGAQRGNDKQTREGRRGCDLREQREGPAKREGTRSAPGDHTPGARPHNDRTADRTPALT
ncbi:hypothetical protein MICRO8M_60252 [Microbacterium sp. 8M]|nr:hypothetical protein MICRO8M_60252 [Microbacterium sp. 8M]